MRTTSYVRFRRFLRIIKAILEIIALFVSLIEKWLK